MTSFRYGIRSTGEAFERRMVLMNTDKFYLKRFNKRILYIR
jgi:hypothetical protein